jgi:hypothetical protein|nr:MAG TPA: hypothetical protein [Caudoviricetes sp.]
MERLTYVTENGEILFHTENLPEDEGMTIQQLAIHGRWEELNQIAEKLTNMEQMEEQGILVRLPRKAGGTVYTLSYRYDCKNDYDCKAFQKWKCEENIPCEYEKKEYFVKKTQFCLTMLNSLGKTVFLTREEAEKALEEIGK